MAEKLTDLARECVAALVGHNADGDKVSGGLESMRTRRALLGHKHRCFDCSFSPFHDEAYYLATASENLIVFIFVLFHKSV
jgi:hypothetical protein